MKKKVVALLAVAMLTFATSAMAANDLILGGNINWIQLLKSTDGGVNFSSITDGGGSLNATLNGKQLDYLYCADIETVVYAPGDYNNTSVSNNATIHSNTTPITVYNAGKVAYLLEKYGVNGVGDQTKQAALQAAIWTEIYSTGLHQYKLDINTDTHTGGYASNSTIATLYTSYLADASTHTGDVSKLLWLSPAISQDPRDFQGLVTSSHAPEPSTIVLLVTGMLGMAVFGKRRMIKAA